MARKSALANLAAGGCQFLLRRGQILFEATALGGDVDGARGVEFDDDGAGAEPDLQGRRGVEIRTRCGQPGQRRHRGTWVLRCVDTGQPGRHLLPVGQTLIAAEPANLGHQLLHIAEPLRGKRIQADPGRLRPVGDNQRLGGGVSSVSACHSASVTNGMTGCSSRSSVSSTAASTAVVWVSPSASCTFATSTYQSQNSSHVK